MLPFGCIVLALAGSAQDAVAGELWKRVCEATAASGESGPIREFALQAGVLTRDGVQTNEFRADYRWLEPNHVRFKLESGRETGRGPGRGQKAYWLKEKDEIVILEGREHAQDRKLVDEMNALFRNFVALTDPAKLETTKLTLEPDPPSTIHVLHRLRRLAEKVRWLSFSSPDFALFRE
ncbi:MAG: hypothetical protein O7B99_12020, partial [Planctomycetota bacterium]|nr:hypothetical protein [Planctomycetota bacterium]